MSGLWFRIYDEALDDPRLQRLPASLFRAWFNVLCAASRNGGTLPKLPELAFMMRTRPGALSRRLDALKAMGLVEDVDGELRPVDWGQRQFVRQDTKDGAEPMSAAERTRRWRERRARDAASVTGDATVTPIEEERELETETQTAPGARESAIDAFEEFWRVFPRRDGDNPRAPALAAWRKAIAAGADPARMVAGAKAYAASVAGRERRFVMSAARWLAEERWPAAAPAATVPRVEMVWVSATSPEWRAWADRWRASKGKSPPVDAKGGWRFPLQYRPAPLENAA
jgi:hypothetical protein